MEHGCGAGNFVRNFENHVIVRLRGDVDRGLICETCKEWLSFMPDEDKKLHLQLVGVNA